MKFSVRTRAIVVAAASVSLLAVPLALPASAAQPGACKKLATKTVGTKTVTTVSSCTPAAATGGSGTGAYSTPPKNATKGSLTITITWAKKHGTTKGVIQFVKQKTLGKCPKVKGETRTKITGKVTGGTGIAFKTIKKGQPITGSICNGKTLTLEPGTSLKF